MNDLEHITREAQAQVTSAITAAEAAREAVTTANEELRAANARVAALVAENARLRAIISDLRERADKAEAALAALREELHFYAQRCNALQAAQSRMQDPERKGLFSGM